MCRKKKGKRYVRRRGGRECVHNVCVCVCECTCMHVHACERERERQRERVLPLEWVPVYLDPYWYTVPRQPVSVHSVLPPRTASPIHRTPVNDLSGVLAVSEGHEMYTYTLSHLSNHPATPNALQHHDKPKHCYMGGSCRLERLWEILPHPNHEKNRFGDMERGRERGASGGAHTASWRQHQFSTWAERESLRGSRGRMWGGRVENNAFPGRSWLQRIHRN